MYGFTVFFKKKPDGANIMIRTIKPSGEFITKIIVGLILIVIGIMNIKGNIGNFKSAIDSLKWFGWGDKVSINKLWQTDNILQNQYMNLYNGYKSKSFMKILQLLF